MKKSLLLPAVILGAAIVVSPVFAAAGSGPKARIFAKYDTNKNGVIDSDEIAVVRKAFAADPKGEFAAYDKDHDGKLSDEEIAAIKPPGQGGKKGGDKKSASDEKSPAPK
ncbi:MAG: EF-hand domain-containing protein [Opitutaceae bacterium]